MAVRAGDAAALLVASDASAGSVADIKGARDIPVYILPLDREALGRRIGKGDRAVIALRRGGPATDLLKWLQRRVALSA
jgi:ribosomal protein L7Ae-like RNA K-turn-binding protein